VLEVFVLVGALAGAVDASCALLVVVVLTPDIVYWTVPCVLHGCFLALFRAAFATLSLVPNTTHKPPPSPPCLQCNTSMQKNP
jgi:hypothetical protein